MADDGDDYKVGYGKPPRHSRYKAGQSGNPKGRKKNTQKNPQVAFIEELEKKIYINEGGKRKPITKLDALFIRIINDALKGGPKEMNAVLKMLSDLEKSGFYKNVRPNFPTVIFIDDIK